MYQSKLNLIQTEIAIKKIKDHFENRLAEVLKLRRVSAPLFLEKGSGLNDNLNGTEKPVSFEVDGKTMEIVHSLAKWKRNALYRYGFKSGTGLYTDMNAIRKDEKLDAIHSLYVDQWDWEKIIKKEDRNMRTLKSTVRKIYGVLRETEIYIKNEYNYLSSHSLPENIFFITTQELEDKYPTLTPKQRERAITKEKKAVFLMQIGDTLKSGIKHDGRSSDYDDWKLNGDILVYNEVLDDSFELSSMGIRVDREALLYQLEKEGNMDRVNLPYHKMVLDETLPYTIGGGIGQSRMCMFFLEKAHIGEVQASFWSDEEKEKCEKEGIFLL